MFVGQFEFVLCVLALRMLVVRVRDSGLRFGGLYEYRVWFPDNAAPGI